jgi:deoxyadenosine/deoxycytidine kinase
MRIEFCGPMGAGKTTVAKALADYYGWTLVEEPVAGHPFLEDFYTDPRKYGFENAAFFTVNYIHNVKKLERENTIYDAGHLGNQSYNALSQKTPSEEAAMSGLYAAATALPKPDLIIYLDYPTDKILERITSRGREMEKDVPASYIRDLKDEMKQRLDKANAPILRLRLEEFDVVARPDDVKKIARLVTDKLKTKYAAPKRPAP